MISDTRSAFMENIQLLEAVDTLFDELKLSFQWRQPSYMISIYNSAPIQNQAMTALEKKLLSAGYSVYPVDASAIKFIDFIETIFEDNADNKKAYFIENIHPSMDQQELNLWRSFVCQRNEAHKKLVRLVFWLKESDLIDLVQNFPDFWENRYRVIDLTDGSEKVLEHCLQGEQPGLNNPDLQASPESEVGNTTALLEQEVRELLSEGLSAWQQSDFYNACQYLQNAADLADVAQVSQLQIECQQALALTHTDLENYDLAIEAYEKILELSPQDNLSWNKLGNLYLQLSNMIEALGAFQRAVNIDQNNPVSWDGIARVYHQNGLTDEAISCYRRAINLVPDFANAWEGLGILFEELNRLESAVKSYRKTLSKDPSRISTWIRLAHIYARREKAYEAKAILTKASELYPSEIRIWLELGNLYLNFGEGLAAVDAFTKALVLNPRHGHAYCKLAEAQKAAGNIPDAISCYELGINFIDDEQQRAESWQNLLALKAGQNVALRQGLPIDASTCLESVVSTEEVGQADESSAANFAVQTCLEQPEKKILSPSEWNEVGNSHFVMGNYDQAIQAYVTAIESSPEAYWPYIHNLATANLHKGKMNGEDQPEIEDSYVADVDQSTMETEEMLVSEAPVQTQPNRDSLHQISIKNIPSSSVAQESKESLQRPGRPVRHLDSDQVEWVNSKTDSAKYCCPSPIRNSKEWSVYLNYSDRILSSWTQYERNKLLLDAFLEQPRAERRQSRKNSKNRLAETDMPIRQATDVNYEKNILGSRSKSYLDAPDNTTSVEDEKWAQAWIRQGNFLVRKGAYDDAGTAFSMAINLAPNLGSTYNSLGLVYFHQEKYREALSHFIKSIGLVDDVKEKEASWNYLGDTYRRLQDEEHALQAYQKAAELSNYGSPLKWRARNLLLHNCH